MTRPRWVPRWIRSVFGVFVAVTTAAASVATLYALLVETRYATLRVDAVEAIWTERIDIDFVLANSGTNPVYLRGATLSVVRLLPGDRPCAGRRLALTSLDAAALGPLEVAPGTEGSFRARVHPEIDTDARYLLCGRFEISPSTEGQRSATLPLMPFSVLEGEVDRGDLGDLPAHRLLATRGLRRL